MMHRRMQRTATLSVLAVITFAAACAGDAEPVVRSPVEPSPQCTGHVEIAVSTGTATPGITWSPACGIDRLMVEDVTEPAGIYGIAWGLVGAGARIFPAVSYGSAPAGASPLGPGTALVPQRQYRVRVLLSTGSGELVIGQATFTP